MHTGLVRFVAFSALFVASAAAQPYSVGWRDMPFPNRTSSGSAILQARVYYPSTGQGQGAPVLGKAGGWPVVVFLHGAGSVGSLYIDISGPLAKNGFVAVMTDSALSDWATLAQDGIAHFATLTYENQNPSSPFYGALDMSRAGIQSSSMGGLSCWRVLASNPGYRCGFFHAPANNGTPNAQNVTVPIAFVHGTGDQVVPWSSSVNYLNAAFAVQSLKFLYLLNQDCDHNNMCSCYLNRPQDLAVMGRIQKVFVGFFRCYLNDDSRGLESAVGTEARADSRLVQLSMAVQRPEVWVESTGQLGAPLRISEISSPGSSTVFVALARSFVQTPWGPLLIDLATATPIGTGTVDGGQLRTLDRIVPNNPTLVGHTFSFQATGFDVAQRLRLSGASDLRIDP